MSTTIKQGSAGSTIAPTRAATTKSPAPTEPRPVQAGDRLGLSTQVGQLEQLKAQLASPIPPLPSVPPSQDWQTRDLACRQALIQTLLQDEAVMKGLRSWPRLPQDLRMLLGERIATIQGGIYGFHPRPLGLEQGPYRGGFQAGSNQPITFGPKSMVSAAEFLNTLVHEQTHAMQWEKGDAASRKKLDPADPYAAIATTWFDNFFDYTPPSKGVRAYRAQPVEQHAYATGDAVAEAVLRKP
ncbi:MAG TPA: hypothetical protein V6D05_15780 [Stenomitos sp.]